MNRLHLSAVLFLTTATAPCLRAGQATGVMTGYVGQQPTSVTASPVSIAIEHKTVQTLADGTHLTRITHEWFYRDGQGRIRMEFELNGGSKPPRTSVILTDPVAGSTMSWMSGPGAAEIYSLNHYVPVNAATVAAAAAQNPGLRLAPPEKVAPRATVPPASPPAPGPPPGPIARADITREDLGTQQVQGAACRATRVTTVYPIDMLGNDRPIKVVNETCTSREFARVLSEHRDDPRSGIRTLTVTAFSRTEPDATLFQPPKGYTERPHVDPSAPGAPVNQ